MISSKRLCVIDLLWSFLYNNQISELFVLKRAKLTGSNANSKSLVKSLLNEVRLTYYVRQNS